MTNFDAIAYWVRRQRHADHSGNTKYSHGQRRLQNRYKRMVLISVLGSHAGIERIADLGAGGGWVTSDLPFPVEVDRLDISPDAVARMQAMGRSARVGTAEALVPVDLVVAYDVLYHIIDDEEFEAAVDSIRHHSPLLLVSDGFVCPVCITGNGHTAPHCRHRKVANYPGHEIGSWRFPPSLPDIDINRIKLLRMDRS